MYFIAIEDSFEAAHFLREYGGRCERLHGHRFKVVVRVRSAVLDNSGMAYDFTVLKEQVKGLLAEYDHYCLNEVPPFDRINPTSESIAETIYGRLATYFKESVILDSVEVWESPNSCAVYKL
ncbi:MAG: 6-carboxytetrahydropterin synthase QueD [Dehalococcoidia bacterium]|nr:6-carboxytetrahydropterin synthase QueD [Dehalococcoidia bacterium]